MSMSHSFVEQEARLIGTLSCLCCTSTLPGVNSSAKRVILESPNVGVEFLTLARYKQMIGRAGRDGLYTSGRILRVAPEPSQRLL